MTEPIYDGRFEDLYATLPDIVRNLDAQQSPSWPMKRYLAGVGVQLADILALIDRFFYLPEDLRRLRHIEPPPSGFSVTVPHGELVGLPQTAWTDSGSSWTLSGNADGAYVLAAPYLAAGTYRMTWTYPALASNGTVTVLVNQQVLGQFTEDPAGGTVTRSFTFTVENGYAAIQLRYDNASQPDNAHRISVTDLTVTNLSAGYEFGTSDLVDPYAADKAWLPWLAMMLGATLDQSLPEAAQRNNLRDSTSGLRAGTKQALITATQPYLSGTKSVMVFDHSTDAGNGVGIGTEWDVLIVTRADETPTGIDVPALLAPAKPAGVKLWHRVYTASWSTIMTKYPTWADWAGQTWASIESAGLDG
jgi:hypothetical protein